MLLKYLITKQNCDQNSRGQHGWTLLHYASEGGYMNIIQYLITELGCDSNYSRSTLAVSHYTLLVLNGHLNATKYFITEQKCRPL